MSILDKKNIGRWIYASVAKHFSSHNNDSICKFYIEGQDINEEKLDRVELRVDGPFFSHPTKHEWYLDIEINLLVTCGIAEQDIFKLWGIIGNYIEAYVDSIPIFKYGDALEDDQSYLGCAILQHDRGEDIVLTHFGRVDPHIRVQQSVLNAMYQLCFFATDPIVNNTKITNNLILNQNLIDNFSILQVSNNLIITDMINLS